MQWLDNLRGKQAPAQGLSGLTLDELVQKNLALGVEVDKINEQRLRIRAEMALRITERDSDAQRML